MTQNFATSIPNDKNSGTSYVLKWSHGTEPRYSWFIRGINPDRSMYGEITMFLEKRGLQVNVTGKLNLSDYALFLSIIKEIDAGDANEDTDEAFEGLLAVGPVAHPRITFKYNSKTSDSEAGTQFLKLVVLLKPYLDQFYDQLERRIGDKSN